jgi:hypothetical protein
MNVITLKQGYSKSFTCTANVTGITDYSEYTAYFTIVKGNKITDKVLQKTSTDWDSNVVVFNLSYSDLTLTAGNYILEFSIASETYRYLIAEYMILIETSVTTFA